MIFQHEKAPFQAIKTRSSKSRIIGFFPKGLTHGFVPKMTIFPSFFFLGNIGQDNVFYNILERKKVFLGYKIEEVQKVEKLTFFQRGGFSPKMAIFRTFFLKIIQTKKMSFIIFQNEKTPFQAIKTRSSKSRKLTLFQRG